MPGMGIGLRLGGQRAGGGFNPAALFGADLVSWYDPSDPATLFQDSAGATPVTASGQSIGRVNDKGSAGLPILQASSGLRPLYNVSSGLHSAAFDGSDDAMATAGNLDLTGTDKVTIFAAVKKNNQTAAILAETSATVAANVGTFYVVTGEDPPSSGNTYSTLSRGAATANLAMAGRTTAGGATDTAVITATHDIAGDLSSIRRNGVAGTDGAADKGAGNFGAYPLYVGARGGTSLRLNGNIYQLLIVRRLCTPDEIAATEAWLAEKCGVTL